MLWRVCKREYPLCDVMLEFYPKEILKIGERISRFEQVRDFWVEKTED